MVGNVGNLFQFPFETDEMSQQVILLIARRVYGVGCGGS